MKEKLLNNLGLKILSIFLAFVIWFVVVNVSNPEVSRSKEVAVNIVNDSVLTSAEKTYEITGKETVTVVYDVRTRDAFKVSASDFRAYIDLSQLYSVTGSVPVQVEVLNNKDIIMNATAKPGVVHVDTEDLQTKRFDLLAEQVGETESGYASDGLSLSPEYVTLQGPVSKVGQVSAVGIEINIAGSSSNVKGVAAPIFYDANGNRFEPSSQVEVSPEEISYEVVINKVKELPLDFEVTGNVASGYQYVGIESSRKNVSVIGLKSNLASVNKITIPASELDLSGASENKTVQVDLTKYLPEGIRLAESESPVVEICMVVEKLVTRALPVTENDVKLEGEQDRYVYDFRPSRVSVMVQGLREELDTLTAADLDVTVDVSDMTPGMNEGWMTFGKSDGFTILGHEDFQVEVLMRTGVLEAPQEPATQPQEPDSSMEESRKADEPSDEAIEAGGTVQETHQTVEESSSPAGSGESQ